MIRPQKRRAKRPSQLQPVPNLDFLAKSGRHQPMRKPANVKMQQSSFRASLQRISRAIASGWEPAKLQLAILTRKILKRIGQPHGYSDDIGREADNVCDACCKGYRVGYRLGHDFNIGQNARLTGVDHVVAPLMAPKYAA